MIWNMSIFHTIRDPEMMKVTSAEFQRHVGRYQDEALREPLSITRNGRERVVLLSMEEYRRLKRREQQALRVEDLGDRDLVAIEQAEVPARFKDRDSELTDR